jgi:hypothetical protein
LTAQTFDGRSRIVAHAIDRKERDIGSIDQIGQQATTMFDAAIVVKEVGPQTLDYKPELWNGVRSASHIKHARLRQLAPL